MGATSQSSVSSDSQSEEAAAQTPTPSTETAADHPATTAAAIGAGQYCTALPIVPHADAFQQVLFHLPPANGLDHTMRVASLPFVAAASPEFVAVTCHD